MLSPEAVSTYHERGWLAPIDVLSPDEAEQARQAFERAEHEHPEALGPEMRNNAHLVFPFLAQLATDPRIVDAVESLVGGQISLWSTVAFVKEPDARAFVSWHQDAFYMGLDGDNFVTAWLALTPSTAENGCVAVIPESHRRRASHHDTFGEHNILTRGQTVADVDESVAVDLVLQPGQMSLHHPWLIHGSRPNCSDDRRIGIAFQSYLGADVRPARGEHHVMAIRGDAPSSAFVPVPAPSTELDPVAVLSRRRANDALSSVLYDGAETVRPL